MATILRVRPPQSNTVEFTVFPVAWTLRGPWNSPLELSGTFSTIRPEDWPENDASPTLYFIQQGSYIEVWIDGVCEFAGRWENVTRTQADGRATVFFGARDKLAVLEHTIASITVTGAFGDKDFYGFNHYTGAKDAGGGSLTSPTRVQLYPGQTRDGDPWPHTWYPKYDSAVWLPERGTSRDLGDLGFYDSLGANLTATATEIKLSQDFKGFPQSGFVSIGNAVQTTYSDEEWLPYDGYTWDEATGYFWLNKCVREATNGWLGSATRRAHSGELVIAIKTATAGSTGTFTVLGDQTAYFAAGKVFLVVASTGNNGIYTVISSSFAAGDTTITVATVADGTDDGTISRPADVVYFRIPRRMHHSVPVLIEGYTSAETYYEPVSDTHFKLNAEEFGVSFQREPLTIGARGAEGGAGYAGRSAYDTMWITAGYHDEDGAGSTIGSMPVVYLGAFLQSVYEQAAAKLGPAWGGTDADTCTVNNALSPDIPITNVNVIRPGMTNRELTDALLNDLGLNRGQGKDAIIVQYNPATDQIDIMQVAQAATPDHYYTGERSVVEALPPPPPSALLVRSSGNDEANKLAEPRMWHTPVGDVSSPLTIAPLIAHKFGDDGGASGYPNVKGWKHAGITNYDGGGGGIYATFAFPFTYNMLSIKGQAQYPNLLTDNSDKTGFALCWDAQPSAGSYFYAWCPDVFGASITDKQPDLFRITRCLVAFDMAGTVSENNTTNLLDIQMLGYQDLTPDQTSTYETEPSGTPIGMGTGSRFIMPPGSYDRPEPVVWEFETDVIINGISLYVRKLPKTQAISSYFSSGFPYMLPLIEIAIFAEPYRADVVQGRAAYSTSHGRGNITAPSTVGKLLGSTMGQHNAQVMDIGPASPAAATSLGVLQLVTGWRGSQPRSFENESTGMDLGGIPRRGNTARHCTGMPDEFDGVIEEFTYREEAGRRYLSDDCRNYNTDLYGVAN